MLLSTDLCCPTRWRHGSPHHFSRHTQVLRLGWLYRLSPHLRNHHAVVTLMVLVEAFRWVSWGASSGSAVGQLWASWWAGGG